jgi:2-phosphosulfolactate phosphatase
MTMVAVSHRGGLEGTAGATGPTVVIDTFRAFSTAAYLIAAGAGPILLAETIDEARAAAARIDAAILCGEDRGRQPPDFDLGNSPGEVIEARYLEGRPVVQRTSAGTRCARAAMRSGAKPLYAASLVVASATARSLAGAASVSIIASGRLGTIPVEEDDATAHLIGALITGTPVAAPNLVGKIRRGPSAERLRRADWAHDDDLDLCLDVDRFDFSMRVVAAGRDVILEPEAAQ